MIAVVCISARFFYEKYLLSQKNLDLAYVENVYKMQFWGGWNAELTDEEYINRIMKLLPNAKATNMNRYEDLGGQDYTVYIYYTDENGDNEVESFEVIRDKKKYYIEPFYTGEVWQIDEDLYQLLFETTIKLRAGELN